MMRRNFVTMVLAGTLLMLLLTALTVDGYAHQCHACTNQPSHEACRTNGYIQQCNVGDDGGCQTEIRVQGSNGNTYLQISKRCKQLQACENDATNSLQWFQGYDVPGSGLCECCSDDLCNDGSSSSSDGTGSSEATTNAPVVTQQPSSNTRASQCYACNDQPSHEACMTNGYIQHCNVGDGGGCQTEIRVDGSVGNTRLRISKRCKQLQACQNDAVNSLQWFQGFDVPGSALYECCSQDLCNDGGITSGGTGSTASSTKSQTTTTQALPITAYTQAPITAGTQAQTTQNAGLTTKAPTTTRTTTQPPSTTPQTTTTTTSSSATISTTSSTGTDNSEYSQALHKSILFYEAQRSGDLPANNRIAWRADSALGDGSDNGVDLTGGWYDAGDHVKFNFPMAWSVTTLAWGLIEFKDGYTVAGELDAMYDSIKWPLDYFIKCHVSPNVFYGQVGNGYEDHSYWGRPEAMTMFRPSWMIDPSNPGSDLAGETAAAMAASSIAFQNRDSSYASTLLQHARDLYSFAKKFRGSYSQAISNADSFYSSSGDQDEMAWAAAWLYRTTGESNYLNDAKGFYDDSTPWAYSWDDKMAGVQLMMYIMTRQTTYKQAVKNFINSWLPGGTVTYTPQGLAWRDQWGPLRYSANSAFIALVAAKHGVKVFQGRTFAQNQTDYMLGNSGRSYVVGYGNNPPQRPHHRSASCPSDISAPCDWSDYNSPGPNPNILEGALVGGPDQWDNYADSRSDYIKNEVACDYNAGFQGALAGLVELQ